MQIIAGLGNPGEQYRNNRHNIGFMAADAIADRQHFGPFRNKFQSLLAEGEIAGEKVLLVKPQTFMNRSGDAIRTASQFYKLGPEAVTVLYDELDLTPGKLRVKTGGGAGGHNGIRSIDAAIGPGYRRVRLGIGHPGHKDAVMPHVLGDFAKADQEWLVPLLEAVADNIALLVDGEDNTFMNRVAIATSGDGAARPERPTTPDPGRPKRQSHIRAARPHAPQAKLPEQGPMAEMLRKILKRD
jgi:PTH1 family peptidyl-tRNA hydrolase